MSVCVTTVPSGLLAKLKIDLQKMTIIVAAIPMRCADGNTVKERL
jgi:hypothetical protein